MVYAIYVCTYYIGICHIYKYIYINTIYACHICMHISYRHIIYTVYGICHINRRARKRIQQVNKNTWAMLRTEESASLSEEYTFFYLFFFGIFFVIIFFGIFFYLFFFIKKTPGPCWGQRRERACLRNTCHIIIHTMSHHHSYYVTSSFILCHIIRTEERASLSEEYLRPPESALKGGAPGYGGRPMYM